jgi:prophage regulatory protein
MQLQTPRNILRTKEATKKVGLGPTTLYYMRTPSNRRFDASWPKPIRLGPNAIGYYEDELDAWLQSREEVRQT